MNKDMKITIAGMFAMTNIGMPLPSVDNLARTVKRPPKTTRDSIIMLGGDYIESEAMLKMFVEEADSWVNVLEQDGEEKSRAIHPEHWELYDKAVLLATQGAK